MTPAEFAAKVKAQYPQYASMDDSELVSKMLAKYPQYASQIDNGAKNDAATFQQRQAEIRAQMHGVPDAGLAQRVGAVKGGADAANVPQADMGSPTNQRNYAADIITRESPVAPFIGAAKGAASDTLNALKTAGNYFSDPLTATANTIVDQASNAIPNDPNAQVKAALEPQGALQGLGNMTEKLAPFIATEGAAGAAGAATQAATGSKALAYGAKGLANLATGTGIAEVQGSEHPFVEGALNAAIPAAGDLVKGGVGLAGKAIRYGLDSSAGKAVTGGIKALADEFGVPITAGQAGGSKIISSIERFMRAHAFGAQNFHAADVTANKALQNAAENVGESIGGVKLGEAETNDMLQKFLTAADKQNGEAYGAAKEAILGTRRAAGGTYGDIPLAMNSELQQTAAQIADTLRANLSATPSLQGAEGMRRALAVLDDFANPYKEVTTGASTILGPDGAPMVQAITKQVPNPPTVGQADFLSRILRDMTQKGELNLGEQQLKLINGSLNQSMDSALAGVDSNAAKAFRDAREAFKTKKELTENSVIMGILKTDQSERGLNMLLSRPVTGMENIQKILKPEQVTQLRRSMWEKLLTDSTDDGILIGRKLDSMTEKLGPEGMKAIFGGSEQFEKIQKFVKLADQLNHTKALAQSPAMGGGSIGIGSLTLMGAGVSTAGVGVLSGNPGTAKWGLRMTGIGAMGLVGPSIMSKILSHPVGVELATKALTEPPTTTSGKLILAKLLAIAGVKASQLNSTTPVDAQ